MNASNPFKQRKVDVSNTFLLNYGEENFTMHHLLRENKYHHQNRNNVKTELTILERIRKEAFGSYATINEEDEVEEYCPSLAQSHPSQADSFWKYLHKERSTKPLTNPFIQSSSYSQYGPLAANTKKSEQFLRQSRSVKEILRKELSTLKDRVRTNGAKPKEGSQSSSSVAELYKEKRKNNRKDSCVTLVSQISFCRPLERKKIRSITQNETPRFQRTRK